MTIRIFTVTAAEARAVGLEYGTMDWGDKAASILIEKGFPPEKLYEGSMEIAGFWDENLNLYVAPTEGRGGISYQRTTRDEVQQRIQDLIEWVKNNDS